MDTKEKPISETVYDELRHDIVFCKLHAGDKLKIEGLKREYNTSTSTIREALNRLTSEELVVGEMQRGFFVSPMSDDGLREIADLRILLEGHAMKLSFEAGDTQWESQVLAAHHRLKRAEERMYKGEHEILEEWKHLDSEFHATLISACGSQALMRLHGSVSDRYLRYQLRVLTYRGEHAAREHEALKDAALDRDFERASETLRAHIEGGVRVALEDKSKI